MRLFSSLGLGLLALATTVLAQEESLAVELDRGTFRKFVQNNHVVLTECEYLSLLTHQNIEFNELINPTPGSLRSTYVSVLVPLSRSQYATSS